MKWLAAVCVVVMLIAVAVVLRSRDDADDELRNAASESAVSDDFGSAPDQTKKLQAEQGGNPFSTTEELAAPVEVLPIAVAATANANLSVASRSGCANSITEEPLYPYSKDTEVDASEVGATESSALDSTVDKEACFAAANEFAKARWLFDVTPTQVVWYSMEKPNVGFEIRNTLLSRLCSGNRQYESTYQPKYELAAITATSTTRILVGERWVSDGTILSPLTEAQYARIVPWFIGRQRSGVGPGENMSRARFDRHLEEKTIHTMVAEEQEQKHMNEERRRAQQGLSADCTE